MGLSIIRDKTLRKSRQVSSPRYDMRRRVRKSEELKRFKLPKKVPRVHNPVLPVEQGEGQQVDARGDVQMQWQGQQPDDNLQEQGEGQQVDAGGDIPMQWQGQQPDDNPQEQGQQPDAIGNSHGQRQRQRSIPKKHLQEPGRGQQINLEDTPQEQGHGQQDSPEDSPRKLPDFDLTSLSNHANLKHRCVLKNAAISSPLGHPEQWKAEAHGHLFTGVRDLFDEVGDYWEPLWEEINANQEFQREDRSTGFLCWWNYFESAESRRNNVIYYDSDDESLPERRYFDRAWMEDELAITLYV